MSVSRPAAAARALLACLLFAAVSPASWARGASPYLPLNLSPEIERQIERVLILADRPITSRPIAAATVLDALPSACRIDAALCTRVRRYLDGYMRKVGLVEASVEGVASDGATRIAAACAGVITEARMPMATVGRPMPITPFTKPASR